MLQLQFYILCYKLISPRAYFFIHCWVFSDTFLLVNKIFPCCESEDFASTDHINNWMDRLFPPYSGTNKIFFYESRPGDIHHCACILSKVAGIFRLWWEKRFTFCNCHGICMRALFPAKLQTHLCTALIILINVLMEALRELR